MSKILIVYYSQSGSTEKLAKLIQSEVGGTLATVADTVDLAEFDTVFVGTPNHAAGASQPVKDFLASHDLSGKKVVPFCTHGMGGEQNTASDIAKLCPNSTILTSFAVKGVELDSAKAAVLAWLEVVGK
ncbi:MAG: hypothetical protein LBN30_03590 [Oscillospiraceae bacterium]|jgi:flavodoxin|nr:hypothetical protein [Oscillospiraceae bacterium]